MSIEKRDDSHKDRSNFVTDFKREMSDAADSYATSIIRVLSDEPPREEKRIDQRIRAAFLAGTRLARDRTIEECAAVAQGNAYHAEISAKYHKHYQEDAHAEALDLQAKFAAHIAKEIRQLKETP